LAEAFGCRGYRVEAAAQLLPILEEALAQPTPVIVDCPVDYRDNDQLTAL
jgi:acetolactate synthase I/II/III large subunit